MNMRPSINENFLKGWKFTSVLYGIVYKRCTFIIGILFHTCTLDFCIICPIPISNMISGTEMNVAPRRYGIRNAAVKQKCKMPIVRIYAWAALKYITPETDNFLSVNLYRTP